MAGYRATDQRRGVSVLGVLAVHLLLGVILLSGAAPQRALDRGPALALFDVTVPPLPPTTLPAPVTTARPIPAGEAAPPALRAVPKPVAAPAPVVLPPLPPIPAPAKAAAGAALSVGSAPVPGPGTGGGGRGDGLGSGSSGSGTGGGGTGARLLRGAIVDSDYPGDARRARQGGVVTVGFVVGTDGKPTDCTVTRSSGVASLDARTCRLVEKRFRYAPARDAAGNPVAEPRGWRQSWWLDPARP